MNDDGAGYGQGDQVEALVKARQFSEALTLLESWREQEPWNAEVVMRMAVVHWLLGEPARTLRDLDALLVLDPNNAEALARRAQTLLILGKHEDAAASLAKAEALDPNTPGVLLNRALLLEENGEIEQAISVLSDYLLQIPQDHLAMARRSHLYRHSGMLSRALDDALACVTMQPDDPECHFAEALVRVTLEQGPEALRSCDAALAARANFLPALRLKIDLLADLGRLGEAQYALDKLDQADPNAPYTSLLRARLATERGQYAAALEWIDLYLNDVPDDPYGYYRKGMVLYKMQAFLGALAEFEQFTQLAPRALEGYEQQFLCLLELGRFEDAEHVGAQAMAIQPDSYRVVYNHAFAQLLNGKIEQGMNGFYDALDCDPANEELHLRVHLALSEHVANAERVSWFQEAVRRHGEASPMLAGLLAEAHLENGQLAEALEITQTVLARDPSRPFGYLLGIKALCLLDRYPDALVLADFGVQRLPDDGRLRLARAQLLRDIGKPDEALRELDEAKEMMPENPEVPQQQALVFGSQGKMDDAIRLLREAIALDESHSESYFWLAYFELHKKRYRAALEAANDLLALLPGSPEGLVVRGVALCGLRNYAEAQKDLDIVRRDNPSLYERMSADPHISTLISRKGKRGLTRWLGRGVRS